MKSDLVMLLAFVGIIVLLYREKRLKAKIRDLEIRVMRDDFWREVATQREEAVISLLREIRDAEKERS